MTASGRPNIATCAAYAAVAKGWASRGARLLLSHVLNRVALIARPGAAWLPVT